MTPEALAFLTALGQFGGVASDTFALWNDMAAGISTSISSGWAVNTDGAYRMTVDGELALYEGLTA